MERVERELPRAVQKAAAPGHWKPILESVAFKTIRAQWQGERSVALHEFYERITPQVVATIVGEVFEGGTRFGMSIPPGTLAAAAHNNISQLTPTGRMRREVIDQNVFAPDQVDSNAEENLDKMRQVVLDWVRLEKRIDERDYHADGSVMSDEEIASRICNILGIGRAGGVVPQNRNEAVDAAAQGLARAIQAWLDNADTTPGGTKVESVPPNYRGQQVFSGPSEPVVASLTPEVARQWLEAVLAAWKSRLVAGLPGQIEFEMRRVFREVRESLL